VTAGLVAHEWDAYGVPQPLDDDRVRYDFDCPDGHKECWTREKHVKYLAEERDKLRAEADDLEEQAWSVRDEADELDAQILQIEAEDDFVHEMKLAPGQVAMVNVTWPN
jgi:hypothetical protein